MKVIIKTFLSKLIIYLYTLRGFEIHTDCKIHPDSNLQLGYLNGSKGQLIIRKAGEISKGAVIKCYGGKVNIEQNVFIGEYVIIYGHGGVEIGANSLIAMHTCIVSSNHSIPGKNDLIRSQSDLLLPVIIGSDVWIGAGVKILGGVTIGNGCVIGAGAVVTKDLPAYSMAMGVPAKVIGYRND